MNRLSWKWRLAAGALMLSAGLAAGWIKHHKQGEDVPVGRGSPVTEPPADQRQIWLLYFDPTATNNPTHRMRVDGLTLVALRTVLQRDAAIWRSAGLNCVGGYNPVLPPEWAKEGSDFLAFDVASTDSEGPHLAEVIASAVGVETVHDVCMMKAQRLADRASRQP